MTMYFSSPPFFRPVLRGPLPKVPSARPGGARFVRVLYAAVLFAACMAPGLARAEDYLRKLKERTASITSVQGEFVQETLIPMFAAPVESKGRFVFRRPDSVRWEYTEPMREGLALKGEAGFRWEDAPASRQNFTVRNDPLAGIVARQLVTWITFDAERIGGEYAIGQSAEEPLRLKMTPLRADIRSVIDSITITFRADGTASLVEIAERQGGKTSIIFAEPVVNGYVDDREFEQP